MLHNPLGGWWCARCDACRFDGPYDLGESGAIERWNTRHTTVNLEHLITNSEVMTIQLKKIQAYIRGEDNERPDQAE